MTIEIPLSKRGKYAGLYEAVIDACDADLGEFSWRVRHDGNMLYARRNNYNGKKPVTIQMHREIMACIIGRALHKGEFVDHIDGDGLNNCRSNLRMATRRQNAQNKHYSSGKQPYKGITWHNRDNKYQAQICVDGKYKYLGQFSTPEEAHRAYCEAAKIEFGEFANFGKKRQS